MKNQSTKCTLPHPFIILIRLRDWRLIAHFIVPPAIQDSATLSSTLPEIYPDTAYVVCISVSLGFRHKPSDTALLSVIALTTFNCIVSASVTKGALVCYVVTVH